MHNRFGWKRKSEKLIWKWKKKEAKVVTNSKLWLTNEDSKREMEANKIESYDWAIEKLKANERVLTKIKRRKLFNWDWEMKWKWSKDEGGSVDYVRS